jgi:hypothetical protein
MPRNRDPLSLHLPFCPTLAKERQSKKGPADGKPGAYLEGVGEQSFN